MANFGDKDNGFILVGVMVLKWDTFGLPTTPSSNNFCLISFRFHFFIINVFLGIFSFSSGNDFPSLRRCTKKRYFSAIFRIRRRVAILSGRLDERFLAPPSAAFLFLNRTATSYIF